MTTNYFPPQLVLQQLIQGFQVTQCIYVAAKLGIADLLKDGRAAARNWRRLRARMRPRSTASCAYSPPSIS